MSGMPADRAQAALLRALRPLAGPFTVLAARSGSWSSATFEGARHRLALRLDGEGGDARARALSRDLAACDVPMRGAFVADIVLTLDRADPLPVLGIEALTIDEAAPTAVSRVAWPAG